MGWPSLTFASMVLIFSLLVLFFAIVLDRLAARKAFSFWSLTCLRARRDWRRAALVARRSSRRR